MKLIKVGRALSCDIVLSSENVSSLHAEITVLDNGDIFVTDKNSTNGTFVAGKRIQPNVDIQVRRGDLIQFADMELSWPRVPKPENLDAFKTVVNIGSNFRNDIHLTTEYGSRFHAVLKVDHKNQTFIRDLNSKNGVKVNGLRITANKDIRIKRGDIIVCADEDITEELKSYIIESWFKRFNVGLIAACLVGLCLIGLLGYWWANGIGCKEHSPACKELASQTEMVPSVVLIQTHYDYVIEVENNPVPNWEGIVTIKEGEWVSGTGFFIDDKGHIGTNRHVALPWEYAKDDEKMSIRLAYEQWLDDAVGGLERVSTNSQLNRFVNSHLGSKIAAASSNITELNAILSRLRKANFKITGKRQAYYVAYPGKNYTELSEMSICDFIAESGSEDKDVAILQLNSKKTPATRYFDITKIRTDKLNPQSEELCTIGFPHGFTLGLDKKTHDLQPGVRSCKCSKEPSRYEFEVEGAAVGGQSGSPIFDKYGHLVGLVSKSYSDASTIWAVKAEYLKELYDREATK